jgi:hypothetical protein
MPAMRSLSMYLDREDVQVLVDWLSDEDEIAFVVPTGAPHSWRAVARVPGLADGEYALWHVPAGPVPLVQPLSAIGEPKAFFIPDPWAGWTELRCIQWIGNHYSRLGDVADPRIERWWNKLNRFAKKNAIRVPLGGPLDGPHGAIWAFAGALTACAGGRPLGYQ